ncbi:MAG: SRPBCC family protein [Rhodobacteraceae bacterium]|nr:SRPBCC family protein [Paracoccaceae bacterium]
MRAEDLPEFDPALDLVLVRELAAPRAVIWDCWTQAEHLVHWFVPRPHKVTACHLDVRVGGACNTTFDVEGAVMENRGVYLEVVPQERLVFTDTYTEGWKPAAEPFMTAIVTFEDLGGGRTRYTAVARHRNAETARQHAEMGFQDGWGTVATQLEAYAQGLAR